MEPEGPTSTAHAAGGALSLLAVAAADGAAAADSTATGQQHACRQYHSLPPLPRMLIDTPVCAACCRAGAVLASVGAASRVDSDGQPACEDCGRRLSRCKGKLHRNGAGKCCQSCYNAARGLDAPVVKQQRTKRSYDTLGPTQQWKRRQLLRFAVAAAGQEISCPLAIVARPPIPSPAELIHLPTSVREAIRTVPSLHIPSEQTMIACKQQLATSHATATGTFAGGAFITDPVRLVSVLCAQSPFMAVGGDAGGGRCVLGVTYSRQSVQHFAALLVYEGGDSWLELQDFHRQLVCLSSHLGSAAAFHRHSLSIPQWRLAIH